MSNEQQLRETLDYIPLDLPECYRPQVVAAMRNYAAALSQPMPEAAAKGWRPTTKQFYDWVKRHDMRPSDIHAFNDAASLYLTASPAAPVAAKPEQQAQAGEPREFESGKDVQIRRLESALASKEEEYQRLYAHCLAYKEAITKKDAALQACVEALKSLRIELAGMLNDYTPAYTKDLLSRLVCRVDAAITQAQGAV